MFARELHAGWTSWGNEVLKLQSLARFVGRGDGGGAAAAAAAAAAPRPEGGGVRNDVAAAGTHMSVL